MLVLLVCILLQQKPPTPYCTPPLCRTTNTPLGLLFPPAHKSPLLPSQPLPPFIFAFSISFSLRLCQHLICQVIFELFCNAKRKIRKIKRKKALKEKGKNKKTVTGPPSPSPSSCPPASHTAPC